MELFNIGFVTIRFIDLVDISLVTFLFFKLYEFLRGSLAIRILFAILFVFLTSKLVSLLDMVVLKSILDQFLSLGAIALIIIFSPEIRRFLLTIGKNTVLDRLWQQFSIRTRESFDLDQVIRGAEEIRKNGLGGLIVITGNDNLRRIQETGDRIGAEISERLLFSIFVHSSPLHDGAVIINDNRVAAARCVLPVSDKMNLAAELGLRHRAALGLSETSDAMVIVVSEERHEISIAKSGTLERNVNLNTLQTRLREHLNLKQD